MQPDASHSSAIVADDSRLIRDVLRSKLAQSFREVHQATDGLEALETARRTKAALVILDYRMDRRNGIEACRDIRQLPGYADVPIVLLTAYDDERVQREATRAGVTFVMRKPVIYEYLVQQLAPYLALHPIAVTTEDELARGRDLLHRRRRIEAETDEAKRRYSGMHERLSPLLGSWGR